MMGISYVRQMNGFLDRMKEDQLPANAAKLYLCLFDAFNRGYWKKEWLRLSTDQLKSFLGTSSTSLIYRNRKCLVEHGYIQVRSGYVANRPYTEFRLIPLGGGSPLPEPARLPASGTSTGISSGISNAPKAPSCLAPPPPKTEEYKDTSSHNSIPNINSTSPAAVPVQRQAAVKAPSPQQELPEVTEADFEEIFQVFEVCFGRASTTQEKITLANALRAKGRMPVETALIAMGEAQADYSPELCQRYIQRQLYGTKEPAPRRQEAAAGWGRFRLA